jgi:hypothetical protein
VVEGAEPRDVSGRDAEQLVMTTIGMNEA